MVPKLKELINTSKYFSGNLFQHNFAASTTIPPRSWRCNSYLVETLKMVPRLSEPINIREMLTDKINP